MKNHDFKATLLVKTCGTDTYCVENYKGMTDEEIIDACDPNNFGGRVYGDTCCVYTD